MGASEVKEQNDRLSAFAEDMQRASDRLNFKETRFVDDYIAGIYDFGLRPLGNEPQYGFTLSALNEAGGLSEPDAEPPNMERAGTRICAQESFVLPDVVQVMEGGKRFIPSLVRLACFESVPVCPGQLPYEFRPFVIPRSKFLGGFGNGEINFVREDGLLTFLYRPSDHIEATSDGIEIGPELDVERERKRDFFSRYEQIVRVLRWELYDSGVNVVVAPGLETIFERWEVGYGPIDSRFRI